MLGMTTPTDENKDKQHNLCIKAGKKVIASDEKMKEKERNGQ
jgi:hypothetical protein